MPVNPGRFFGPVMGVLLANLLFKAVSAKYSSYVPFQLAYQPTFLTYGKPIPSYNYHHPPYPSQWYPVKNPYYGEGHAYQSYPTLTTHSPEAYQQDLSAPGVDYDSHYPEEAKTHNVITNIENPNSIQEPIPAESNVNVKRRAPQGFRRRTPPQRGNNRNKFTGQKRRRTTTSQPDDYYYDSYEDYTTEANRRRRPYMEESTESYEEDDYYEYEATTKKKQRRKPTKSKTRRTTTPAYAEFDSVEAISVNPHTEIVIVRQAQTTASTTTTEPTTFITNATTTTPPTVATTSQTATNISSNATAYGYGPSNGNEGISITYGPPVGNGINNAKYYYSSPYFDWYSHDATRNAIVKRVRDIVTFDKKFNLKK